MLDILFGCSGAQIQTEVKEQNNAVSEVEAENSKEPEKANRAPDGQFDEQPSTVYYELFVRSFYDSDGNGIGDFARKRAPM